MKKIIYSLALLLALQPTIAGATLTSYYKELGQKLPSLSERADIYYGAGNDDEYVGSAEQNNWLESYLRNIYSPDDAGLGAITPQPRLLGDNTWTGSNTFNGTTTATGNLIGFGFGSLFGDGSDGDVIISSDTNLSRDMYYNNLTINSGVTLKPYGYRIYVKGTLINNGIISADAISNGGNGVTPSLTIAGGNGGSAGLSATSTGLLIASGKSGSNGGYGCSSVDSGTCANAAVPDSGTNIPLCLGSTGAVGGTSTAGTPTIGTCYPPSYRPILPFFASVFTDLTTTTKYQYNSGNTGGYGGPGVRAQSSLDMGGAGGGGGGSGGNAGLIFISANVYSGNGTTTALGKNGGIGGDGSNYLVNCAHGTSGAGNGGGGGAGGNGGLIFIGYRLKTFTGTSIISGGIGGAGGAGATHACGNGSGGGAGATGKSGYTWYYQY